MYKVDVWVWTDSRSTASDLKDYAYSIEMLRAGRVEKRRGQNQIVGSWNKASLSALAEALERFTANAEVIIHSENRWMLTMIDRYLEIWEGADFWKSKNEKVANEPEWRRIAKAKHSLRLVTDPIGFDRSKELMDHALND